jgi:imidazolonepropionase-like amidohydrolase
MKHFACHVRVISILTLALASAGASSAQVKAFTGARIIDGRGGQPIASGTLIVDGGRVKAVGPSNSVQIPAGAERINVAGKTIVPGLINAHGHVADGRGLRTGAEFNTRDNLVRQLDLYARYGVTSVFSLGGDGELSFQLRNEQDTPDLKRARLFVAGTIITGNTPEQVRQAVDRVAAGKPNILKIRVDDNLGASRKMSPEVYQAVIDQGKKHGLRVAAHMFYLEDAKNLLESGAGLLAHSIRDKEVDDGTIALMKSRDVCITPTLTREVSTFVYESKPAFFDDPFFLRHADKEAVAQLQEPQRQQAMRNSASAKRYKEALEVASRNLKKLSDAGVKIAMGTDTGQPARFQGYFEHMELELMAKAGLTPMQILKSATGDAAACMQMSGRIGTLQPGAWADLVVLESNPLDDIKNLRAIDSVWIAGNQVPGVR